MIRSQGQVAVGLAFAFTAVLAMFGLVFNSSLITREKMQLQQTTDFAALVAADVQRHNLNRIRELNQKIDEAFEVAKILLAPPLPYCELTYIRPAAGNCYTVSAATAWYSGVKVIDQANVDAAPNDEGKKKASNGACESCGGYDSFVRNGILTAYDALRLQYKAQIEAIVAEANQRAYDKVLDTFLTPENLPFGLRKVLGERLGTHLTRDLLRDEYEKGNLSKNLSLVDANQDLRLFIDQDEVRQFVYNEYHYQTIPFPTCHCAPPMYIGVRPAFRTAKVSKVSDYTTSFITGASYTPETWERIVQKFTIYLKSPSKPDPNKVFKELREDFRLFGERAPMHTLALAKPYGGTFPKAANAYNPTDSGDTGKKFEGAKLIGINDPEALGGFDMGFPYQKEFLH